MVSNISFPVTDLEIFQKNKACRQSSQKVLVSIKPRAPAIKTLYIAEKNRFHSRKVSFPYTKCLLILVLNNLRVLLYSGFQQVWVASCYWRSFIIPNE